MANPLSSDNLSSRENETMHFSEAVRSFLLESFSESELTAFASHVCLPPHVTTLRLNVLACSSADERQQRFAELEAAIKSEYAEKGVENTSVQLVHQHPDLPDIAIIKNIPINSEKQSQSKPQCDVFVDESCGCAVLRGADVFVNGIFGAPEILQVDDLVRVFAVCDRHYKKGSKIPYRGELPCVYVGSGISRVDREMLFKKNKLESGLAIRMTEPRLIAPSISALDSRVWIAQNLPSLICALNLEVKPGDRVLDMCAAPGGKCLHLAALMNNEGRIIALDRSKAKIDSLKAKLDPLGVTCVQAIACDSTTIARNSASEIDTGTQNIDIDTPPFEPCSFDRVLLDAPCSNLGQRPRFTLTESVNALRSYANVQTRLFEAAVKLLKPGGTLVYSTCTLDVAENERLVAWALDRFRDVLRLLPQRVHLGGKGSVTTGFPPKATGLSEQQAELLQKFDFTTRLLPASDANVAENVTNAAEETQLVLRTASRDTIGFFIAKFQKLHAPDN